MDSEYLVSFEIAGPAAMFTRPDTGAAQVSYPAPTFSACKGMFEAVARLKYAWIRPTRVEICQPIRYSKYLTNYGGPLRKNVQKAKGSPYQLSAMILVDVCYRIYGQAEFSPNASSGRNHRHALQEIFNRRLARGQFFYAPCLGWKEFVPTYVGRFRKETMKDSTINLRIPSMLHMVFDGPVSGKWQPLFRQNRRIKEGELCYAE